MTRSHTRPEELDTTVLDELEELGKKRSILLGWIENLEGEHRKSVAGVVYRRVHDDYQKRLQEIDGKARPLHEQARAEWATLLELRANVRTESEVITHDVEEIKLRQALGELTEDEVEERLEKMESERQSREKVLAEAEELDARFGRVVEASGGSVEKLRPKDLPAKGAAVEEVQAEEAGPTSGQGHAPETALREEGEEEPSAAAAPRERPEVAGSAATVVMTDAVISEPPRATSPPVLDEGRTRIARPAQLILEEPLDGVEDFRVEPLTSIGRTPQNQIQLDHLSVSRRHAKIALTDEGYVLEDLGSENGIFVNGDRLERRVLQDGDRILIGTVSMVFREPK